jgi:hypothetical protein
VSGGELIEGHVVSESTELAPIREPHASTLFHTDDPVEVVAKASRIADALAPVLRDKDMLTQISGKKHVRVEGWQTLGAMLGVVPVVVWTRPIANTERTGKGHDWEARVEARTLDGRVIGAAEAMCTRDETRWQNADDYAVRSMAQTRATSKALSGPLRFIVTLAGYSGTPAEEVPADGFRGGDAKPSAKQLGFLKRILDGKAGNVAKPSRAHLDELAASVGVVVEAEWVDRLNRRECSALLDKLTKEGPPDIPDKPDWFPEPATDGPTHLGGDDPLTLDGETKP